MVLPAIIENYFYLPVKNIRMQDGFIPRDKAHSIGNRIKWPDLCINKMWKNSLLQVAQKGSDTRRPKSRGMSRTQKYVAMTRDEGQRSKWAFFNNLLINPGMKGENG